MFILLAGALLSEVISLSVVCNFLCYVSKVILTMNIKVAKNL